LFAHENEQWQKKGKEYKQIFYFSLGVYIAQKSVFATLLSRCSMREARNLQQKNKNAEGNSWRMSV
jgi:hypothetical protein